MKRVLVASIFVLASLHGFAQYGVTVEVTDTTKESTVPQTELPTTDSTLQIHNTERSNLKSQPSNLRSTGFLSYDSVLRAMPQYGIVQQHVDELRKAYEAEMKRVEDEFNQKYEDFLEGRKDYPRTILLKRQNELQDMLQQNIAFRNRALDELRQAETDALAPLRQQLLKAVATVAKQKSLLFVLNTDSDACLFLDPDSSIDITADVLTELSKKEQ